VIWRILLALLFASLASGAGVAVLLRLRPALALLWALSLGAGFLWWHLRPARPRRRARVRMRLPRGSPRHIIVASASTLLIALGVAGLLAILVSPLQDLDMAPWEGLLAYQRRPGGWIALTAFVALVVPIIEEFCFRGHIQHTLERRYPPWVAILVTTALFTVVHISPAHSSLLLIPMVLGLGMGVVTVLFQSVWVAVAIHAVWNAAMSIQSVIAVEETHPAEHAGLLPISLVPLAAGLAGWFLVLRHGRYRALCCDQEAPPPVPTIMP
jgi:uncharacterized protein